MERAHPLVRRAARGEFPEWSRADDARRAHMSRVSDLMGSWATTLALVPEEVKRWRGAGLLHDVLRDAAPSELRRQVPSSEQGLPASVLHAPAAAARLRASGVDDEEFLQAVAFHPLGHPEFQALGRALYSADFLDPGRAFLVSRRAGLRERMPHDLESVVTEVAAVRIRRLLDTGRRLQSQTVGFWNRLVEEGGAVEMGEELV